MEDDFSKMLMSGETYPSTTEDKIRLDTRCGNKIPNYHPKPPSTSQPLLARLIRGSSWQDRTPEPAPENNYNCAGHVWANRRTSIDVSEWKVIKMILQDDKYTQLSDITSVRSDDLVLYIDPTTNELLHVARVVYFDHPHHHGLRVVSKMGNQFGEVIHKYDDVNFGIAQPRIEFWTDRLPLKLKI